MIPRGGHTGRAGKSNPSIAVWNQRRFNLEVGWENEYLKKWDFNFEGQFDSHKKF